MARQALEEHLRQRTPREKCRQHAVRLGILGSAEGLPSDLSTDLIPGPENRSMAEN